MIDQASWIAVFPEALLLLMACVIALVDLGVKSPLRTLTYGLSLGTLLAIAAIEAFLVHPASPCMAFPTWW